MWDTICSSFASVLGAGTGFLATLAVGVAGLLAVGMVWVVLGALSFWSLHYLGVDDLRGPKASKDGAYVAFVFFLCITVWPLVLLFAIIERVETLLRAFGNWLSPPTPRPPPAKPGGSDWSAFKTAVKTTKPE